MASIGDENAGCAPASKREQRELPGRRFKQVLPSKERLVKEAAQQREEAKALPPGPAREALLRMAQQTDVAAYLDDWARLARSESLE